MKIASAIVGGQEEAVWVASQGYVPVSRLREYFGKDKAPVTMNQILANPLLLHELQDLTNQGVPVEANLTTSVAEILAPIASPGKIICVGLNYRSHVQESQMEIPTSPVLFNKYNNTVCSSGTLIDPPDDARQMDYEAELVLVIGKTGSHISEERALDYVAGYCNGNDVSARDLQFRSSQWLLGKSCDHFAPMGPYLVTADEISDPDNLEITGWRNEEIVQHANTRDMIFSCRTLISYISGYMTLNPGDVIFTGTPEGVILGKPPESRKWLEPGEKIAVEIQGLGRLVNEMGTPGGTK
jgi:2-keto-4-pentenoate hydratase/2-oxohepta-3-ene-1,7-dioic acid hydratase in catechol pathway